MHCDEVSSEGMNRPVLYLTFQSQKQELLPLDAIKKKVSWAFESSRRLPEMWTSLKSAVLLKCHVWVQVQIDAALKIKY